MLDNLTIWIAGYEISRKNNTIYLVMKDIKQIKETVLELMRLDNLLKPHKTSCNLFSIFEYGRI